MKMLFRLFASIFCIAGMVLASVTVPFFVSGRGPAGRTYTITSTQLGNILNWGQRGIYNFAPVHMPDGSYALLFSSCANPGSGCKLGPPGGVYLTTSPDGVNSWTTPALVLSLANAPIDPINGGRLIDIAAPRVINYNGTWYLYLQATGRPGIDASIYAASGPSLTTLSWLPSPIVTLNPSNDTLGGVGIGEFHQWFNSAAYGGFPGYTVLGVYNDWDYAPAGGQEFAALSTDGHSSQYWYGPIVPVVSQTSGGYTIIYPDVMLSGSTDAASYGDISLTLGDGCFSGAEAYRPVTGLGFYNAPYLYANGLYYQLTPIATYNANPGYSDVVIETSGPNNSGFRPRFARNQYGYIDPVPGSNPRQWQTYVYYTSSQLGLNSDTGCDYTQYNKVNATIGVSLVTITEQ